MMRLLVDEIIESEITLEDNNAINDREQSEDFEDNTINSRRK